MISHSLTRVVNLLRTRQKGLTAIELAVVVAILAVLAALVAGSVTGMNRSARQAAETTDVSEVQKAVDRWVGEQPASRYPVGTPVIVDSINVVASSATPATGGLPQIGSGLYVRIAFSDNFTNPEGTGKSFVPDSLQRVPKFGQDSPNPWVIDEKGDVRTLGLLDSAPTPTPTPSGTATPTPGPTVTSFSLSVVSPWPTHPTIDLLPGRTVSIVASSGNAYFCPTCPVTPDGESPQEAAFTIAPSNSLVPGLWWHALICKVGSSGTPFNVGSSYSFVANAQERLYCTMNDSPVDDYWGWADNSGSWPVTVTVQQ